MTQELGVTIKCSLIIRVTLYAEFLPMKSRATCILLIEVRLTCTTYCISPPTSGCTALRSSVLQIFWALGTVFEVLLAILVMPTLGWRWLLGLSTIPLFIFAILCFVSMLFFFIRLEIFCIKVQLCNCGLACGSAVATRKCSIRRADRKPGKSSGHAEAHCDRKRSAHATGETYHGQTGENLFPQETA